MPWKSPSEAANPTAMARSKSGAKSIRGQISAPIPIADPIDNGFADRTYTDLSREPTHLSSNTGSADAAVDRPIRVVPTAPAENTSSAVRASRSEAVTKRLSVDGTPQRGSLPPTGKRLSKSQSKPSAAPERKRSPIRNAIGRLFGRKKKTVSQLTEPYEPAQRASAPPPNANKIENEGLPRVSGASRSASMPVTEFDRALRSHSVGLDDVIAIHSARNSLNADQIQSKKRSGGSTSPYPLGARYIGDGKLAGLCPRPASANDKDLHGSSTVADDPSEIGRAITSDYNGLKRRSRSMSAMSFFETNQEQRPRTEDIKNFRDSCFYGEDPLSPLSSEFHDDYTMGTFNLDLPHPPRPAGPEPTTPEALMFGNLISEEDAANRQQVEEVTLNSRVNGIENRLHVLEDSVSLLRYKSNPYAANGWKPSETSVQSGLGIQASFSYPNTRNPHHSLSMGITSTRPSTGHSEAVFTESISSHSGNNYTTSEQPATQDGVRPLSEHTLRGQNSRGAMRQHAANSLGEEHYTAILGLLETERSARIALEIQVQQLTRQLRLLLSRQQDYDKAPVSVFDYDADESESLESAQAVRYNVWHPAELRQKGYSLDDSGIDPGSGMLPQDMLSDNGREAEDLDESSSQLYATPNEENHTFGVYGEHDLNASAPRGLSMSRMTMGQVPTTVV